MSWKRRHFLFLLHFLLLCQLSLYGLWGFIGMAESWTRRCSLDFPCIDGCFGSVPLRRALWMALVVWGITGRESYIPFYDCYWDIACVHVWAPVVDSRKAQEPYSEGFRALVCFNHRKYLFWAGFCPQSCWFPRVSALFSMPFSCAIKSHGKSWTLCTKGT